MESEIGIDPGTAAAAGIIGLIIMVFYVAIIIVMVVAYWKIFTKAGEPGWAILIPIYNTIIMLKVAGRPWWWLFLLMLIIPIFIIPFDHAKRFGKSGGFGVGLLLLPIVFYPILAFGSAQYQGDSAAAAPAAA